MSCAIDGDSGNEVHGDDLVMCAMQADGNDSLDGKADTVSKSG